TGEGRGRPNPLRWIEDTRPDLSAAGYTSMPKIQILIADDHTIFRAGLRMLLNAEPDMEVAGEATNGREALRKARELQPDVSLLDITMPGSSGLQALEQLRQVCPHTRVLVLTMHEDLAYVRAVLAGGGSGYVAKRAAHSDLLAAIRAVYQGRTFVDPTLAAGLMRDLLEKGVSPSPLGGDAAQSLLSPREHEVLLLLAQGYTNHEAAKRMLVSTKTVETYRARILQKLGLHSRAELTRYAFVSGFLAPDTFTQPQDDLTPGT
ncbi:MAG: response regulator transcription factor, partial [Candidatus Entotheonellia bacterium]